MWWSPLDVFDAWQRVPGRCHTAVRAGVVAGASPAWVAMLVGGGVLIAPVEGGAPRVLEIAPTTPSILNAETPQATREIFQRAEQMMSAAVVRALVSLEAPGSVGALDAQESALVAVLRDAPALREGVAPVFGRALLANLGIAATHASASDLVAVASRIPAAWRTPVVPPRQPTAPTDGIGSNRQAIASNEYVRLTVTQIHCFDESDPEGSADDLHVGIVAVVPDGASKGAQVQTLDPQHAGDYDTGTVHVSGEFKAPSQVRGAGTLEFTARGTDLGRAEVPFSLTLWDDDSIDPGWVTLANVLHEIGLIAVYATVYYYSGEVFGESISTSQQNSLAGAARDLADKIGRWVGEKIADAADSDFLGTGTVVWTRGAPPVAVDITSSEHGSRYRIFLQYTSNAAASFDIPVGQRGIEMLPYLDGRFATIAAHPGGVDGVLVADDQGRIRRGSPPHQGWSAVAGTAKRLAARGPGRVLFVDPSYRLYQSDGTNVSRFGFFQRVPLVRQVAEGADGTIWWVTAYESSNDDNGGWAVRYVPRPSTAPAPVAVKPSSTYDAQIQRVGVAPAIRPSLLQNAFDSGQRECRLESITVASEGQVWGIDKLGTPWRRTSGGFVAAQAPHPLVQVSCATDGTVLAVDAAGDLFGWDNATNAWLQWVCNVKLREVAVSSMGLVWGLDLLGNVWVSRTTANVK